MKADLNELVAEQGIEVTKTVVRKSLRLHLQKLPIPSAIVNVWVEAEVTAEMLDQAADWAEATTVWGGSVQVEQTALSAQSCLVALFLLQQGRNTFTEHLNYSVFCGVRLDTTEN